MMSWIPTRFPPQYCPLTDVTSTALAELTGPDASWATRNLIGRLAAASLSLSATGDIVYHTTAITAKILPATLKWVYRPLPVSDDCSFSQVTLHAQKVMRCVLTLFLVVLPGFLYPRWGLALHHKVHGLPPHPSTMQKMTRLATTLFQRCHDLQWPLVALTTAFVCAKVLQRRHATASAALDPHGPNVPVLLPASPFKSPHTTSPSTLPAFVLAILFGGYGIKRLFFSSSEERPTPLPPQKSQEPEKQKQVPVPPPPPRQGSDVERWPVLPPPLFNEKTPDSTPRSPVGQTPRTELNNQATIDTAITELLKMAGNEKKSKPTEEENTPLPSPKEEPTPVPPQPPVRPTLERQPTEKRIAGVDITKFEGGTPPQQAKEERPPPPKRKLRQFIPNEKGGFTLQQG